MNAFLLLTLLTITFSTFTMERGNAGNPPKDLELLEPAKVEEKEKFKFKYIHDVLKFREILRVPLTDGYNRNKIIRISRPDRLVLNDEMSKHVIKSYASQWSNLKQNGETQYLALGEIYCYLLKLNFVYTQEKEFSGTLSKKANGNYAVKRFTRMQQLEDDQKYFAGVIGYIDPTLRIKFRDLLTFVLIIKQPDFDDVELLSKQPLTIQQPIQEISQSQEKIITAQVLLSKQTNSSISKSASLTKVCEMQPGFANGKLPSKQQITEQLVKELPKLPVKTATLPIMLSHKTNSTGDLPNRKYNLGPKAASFTQACDLWKEKDQEKKKQQSEIAK